MRQWATTTSGEEAAEFRASIVIRREDYERAKQAAKREGISVREWLNNTARDGFYTALVRADENERLSQ